MAKHIAEQFVLPGLPNYVETYSEVPLKERPRAFFFHFNKPLSRQRGKPQISVHCAGICNIVDNVVCDVPTRGRINKRQPYFVITGRGRLTIDNGIAYIR